MPVLTALLLRRRLSPLVIALALLFAAKPDAEAQSDIRTEYKFKAVFLFHFTQFVDWPVDAFGTSNAPLVIGVLGDNPFGNYLDETVRGETVDGHPLSIQFYRRLADVKNCQMLFISRSEEKHIQRILTDLEAKPILTVSDIADFPEQGGIIGFITVDDKIHFKINLDAAHDANLTFSSKLLRLAQIVTTKRG
jgi:YfiR/HmsC-like